jgi:hypothetical protein
VISTLKYFREEYLAKIKREASFSTNGKRVEEHV